jgi:hypothetical protein
MRLWSDHAPLFHNRFMEEWPTIHSKLQGAFPRICPFQIHETV